MAKVLQRTLDPGVAPTRIVGGHPDREAADLLLDAASTKPRPRVRPLQRSQLAVPPENRVRRDDRRDLREEPAAEALTDDGETPTVVIIQPEPPPVQLRF